MTCEELTTEAWGKWAFALQLPTLQKCPYFETI